MIIELKRNGKLITETVPIDKPPMFAGTILVQEFVVRGKLYEGERMCASYANADGTPVTTAKPLDVRIVTVAGESIAEWFMTLPNAVTKTAGNKVASVFILDAYALTEENLKELQPQKVITSADVPFTVYPNNVNTDFEPLDETVAVNHERRIDRLEDTTSVKTLLDFTVNDQTGEGMKYYSDGTTANIRFPTGGGGEIGIKTDWLKILTFTESSFFPVNDENNRIIQYELAFGPAQTGYENNNYLSLLERNGQETYEVGSETVPSLKTGVYSQSDSVFKGTDGSIYMTTNEPYDGRLILLGGVVFSGQLVTSAEYNASAHILKLNFVNGDYINIPFETKLSQFSNDLDYQTAGEVNASVHTETLARQTADEGLQGQLTTLNARDAVTGIGYEATSAVLTVTHRTGESDALQLPIPGAASRYTSSVSWTGSAGNYTYSVSAATHGKGTNPNVQSVNTAGETVWFGVKTVNGNVTLYSTENIAATIIII